MNKERFLRIYTKFSIFIGLLLILFVFIFSSSFPTEFKSLVETNVFSVTLVHFAGNIVILNTPLFIFLTLLLLNIYILLKVGDTNEVSEKPLQTVAFYNVIITLMLIIGQIAFVLMIPENINGLIQNRFLFYTFESGAGEGVLVLFGSYILAVIYFAYNTVVARKVRLPEEPEEEEIYYTAETIEEINENNEK